MPRNNDFEDIESELSSSAESYDASHANRDLAEAYLTTITDLKDLSKNESPLQFQNTALRHQFQEVFFIKAVNALESNYWLIKHHQYDSAFRNIRYLYESYALLKSLNEDKEETQEIVINHIIESDLLYGVGVYDTTRYTDFTSTDKLHDKIDNVRDEVEEEGGEYERLYNILSNSNIHPARIEGAVLDGEHKPSTEAELFALGLVFAFGLAKEYWKTYADTADVASVYNQVYPICTTIVEELPTGLPTFLFD